MGPTALLPLRRKAYWGFFCPKNPTALAGCEPANLGTKSRHATSKPPKLLVTKLTLYLSVQEYCMNLLGEEQSRKRRLGTNRCSFHKCFIERRCKLKIFYIFSHRFNKRSCMVGGMILTGEILIKVSLFLPQILHALYLG
jgi:hypothetical protein